MVVVYDNKYMYPYWTVSLEIVQQEAVFLSTNIKKLRSLFVEAR